MFQKQMIAKITFCTFDELSETEKKLIQEAKQASIGAYAPYSNFQVGAAVLLENGEVITGSNQENAAYASGMCAERVALFYANSRYPDVKVSTIAVAAQNMIGFTEKPVFPCGACRQVMLETEKRFQSPVRLLLFGQEEVAVVDSVDALLPFGFDQTSMELSD